MLVSKCRELSAPHPAACAPTVQEQQGEVVALLGIFVEQIKMIQTDVRHCRF